MIVQLELEVLNIFFLICGVVESFILNFVTHLEKVLKNFRIYLETQKLLKAF